tara:strand:- start:216 stop:491 length:276 start_codon:yes stop_codon:yes gene_type:complete
MIIKTTKGRYYVNGPFAEVHKNIDTFNSNVYCYYLIRRGLDDYADAEQFLEEARQLEDEELIIEAEKDLAHIDNAFKKACMIIQHFDDILA